MHIPLRLQGTLQVVLGENYVLGDSADTISTGTDGVLLSRRHSTAITANGSSIIRASVRPGLEAGWRGEVKSGEGARFAEEMARSMLDLPQKGSSRQRLTGSASPRDHRMRTAVAQRQEP